MVYKNRRKQRKYQRDYKWAQRHGQKFKNPWKGMEKIGTERVNRKPSLLHLKNKGKGTWLNRPPKRESRNGRRRSSIRG